jgi:hypothetical protein
MKRRVAVENHRHPLYEIADYAEGKRPDQPTNRDYIRALQRTENRLSRFRDAIERTTTWTKNVKDVELKVIDDEIDVLRRLRSSIAGHMLHGDVTKGDQS